LAVANPADSLVNKVAAFRVAFVEVLAEGYLV
jgi:hypothetical protein